MQIYNLLFNLTYYFKLITTLIEFGHFKHYKYTVAKKTFFPSSQASACMELTPKRFQLCTENKSKLENYSQSLSYRHQFKT